MNILSEPYLFGNTYIYQKQTMTHQEQFTSLLQKSVANASFIKLTLANYVGEVEKLKNCYVKKIQLKDQEKLSFTFRYQTNDIVKNYTLEEGLRQISEFITTVQFKHCSLFTLDFDATFEINNKQKSSFKKLKPTHNQLPSLEHNLKKNRLISAEGKHYLNLLNITNEQGIVNNNAQDKYKQINRYVELLAPLLNNLPNKTNIQVADMGSGKGYLTFALYDYLTNELKLNATITGVEFRKDLVDLCNTIAQKSDFKQLQFVQNSIENYDSKNTTILIALHACDTATDDAIYKGIMAKADLIVVAPCCHKQIRNQIEKHKTKNQLDFLLKHGIFLERQAEMVTDGLRALLLEYEGYNTKVFEFISNIHTPKNVMIVAERREKTSEQKAIILQNIKESKAFFGIETHYLEKLLVID